MYDAVIHEKGVLIFVRDPHKGRIMTNALAIFEGYRIRRHFDEKTETWYFSVVDILQVLIQQPDFQTARKYWNKLKERLKNEGSQTVTNCHQLKMVAEDGKLQTVKWFTRFGLLV